jgi:hypothetical protein
MLRHDRLNPCLQHGEETDETSGESAGTEGDGCSGAGELDRLRRSRAGASAVASSDGSLGLTVGDLGNDVGNRGSRCTGLGLTIRNLGDNLGRRRRGGAGLWLSIRDLRNDVGGWWSGCACLGLAIRDLRDDRGGRGSSLRLAVGDLWDDRGDGGSRSGSLRLSVRDLGDSVGSRSSGSGSLGLTVADLRGGARALVDSLNVDLLALAALAVGVQVVEITRQALPESGSAQGAVARGQSETVVAAEREAFGLKSTSLDGGVELELIVASDVSLATGLILQDTILQGQGECAGKLTFLEVTLGGRLDNSLDLEGSWCGRRAFGWISLLLGQCQCGGRKSESEVGLHYSGWVDVVGTER